jgi:hypothetical protein
MFLNRIAFGDGDTDHVVVHAAGGVELNRCHQDHRGSTRG